MNRLLLFVAFIVLMLSFVSCEYFTREPKAKEIIAKSIEASGGAVISNSTISFTFRDKVYKAERKEGVFVLTRAFDSIKDVLTNTFFERYVSGKKVELTDSIANNYRNSVNSVHYFSVLPYGLDAKAVQPKLLGSKRIKGKDYYKIEVRFAEAGGGEDFKDVFVYWINKSNFFVDYLAYRYYTNGGGMRFRELKKETIINGVRLADYNNYKPSKPINSIREIDDSYINGRLEKVSEIILKNIQVKPN